MKKKDRQSDSVRKRTDIPNGKGPTIDPIKRPPDYYPLVIEGVVSEGELAAMLHEAKQDGWITPKRIAGLLLLIDFIRRQGGKSARVSSELSHQYVTRLKGKPGTEEQPLRLLIRLGILEVVRPAKVGPHFKVSAEYRFPARYRKSCPVTVHVSPQQVEKRQNADERNERRKNRKHAFRARLIEDMKQLSLSPDGTRKALEMALAAEKESAVKQAIESLTGKRKRLVSVNPTGTIFTFINRIPKELKLHLEIDGKPVAKCDIEGAHFCLLQRINRDRCEFLRDLNSSHPSIGELTRERAKLAELIEAGGVYSLGRSDVCPEERKANKGALLKALNKMTAGAIHLPQYRWLRESFPLTCGIVEDLKEKDHRTISTQLQNYTARIINGALEELQGIGVPAFPDTDALIVPAEVAELAGEFLSRRLREVCGGGRVAIERGESTD